MSDREVWPLVDDVQEVVAPIEELIEEESSFPERAKALWPGIAENKRNATIHMDVRPGPDPPSPSSPDSEPT